MISGDSCTEKPLNTLWKNYTSSSKPDVQMKLIVTQSGLKAITKEHGLTEYWSHRITYCCAPTELPKIFCWVYRHEGRKLKQELRCHAVLCAKESVARQIANQLQARLAQALIEFKRDKISRQNARLSLANSVYDNPSLPKRKILLSTGFHNYRPPLERSKSAPKLMAIEESVEEEDENSEFKKLPKRADPRSRFATYRNLSYSNRGSRLGGLHGLRLRNAATTVTAVSKTGDSSSEAAVCDIENSSQFEEEGDCCFGEVVEPNPFGSHKQTAAVDDDHQHHVNDSRRHHLPHVFEKQLSLLQQTENERSQSGRLEKPSELITDINENICEPCFYGKSWSDGDEYSSCPPSYVDTLSGCSDELPKYDDVLSMGTVLTTTTEDGATEEEGKFDSLVRSRRRLFENDDKWPQVKGVVDDRSLHKNLVKSRKKLFEGLEKSSIAVEDACCHLEKQFDLGDDGSRDTLVLEGGSGCCSSIDDESTPSLQSISSGSDTSASSPRDVKLDYGKNYDLDSLWEEDSDESGFVESIGQEANDDKIRDLPYHQLVKSCILSSKSRCVEV